MKHSIAAATAGALWAAAAHAQVLPSSGPESTIPVGPDDTPLVSRPADSPLRAASLLAAVPGPYLPNPNDPTTVLPILPEEGFYR